MPASGCSNTKCPQGNLFHPFASNSCIPSHHLVYHYRLRHRRKITTLLSRSHCQLLLLVPSICPVSSADPRANAPGSLGVSSRLSFVFVSIVLYTPALFSIWNPFNHSISYGSFNLVPVSGSLPDPFGQRYFLPTLTSLKFHSISFFWCTHFLFKKIVFFLSIHCVSGIYPGKICIHFYLILSAALYPRGPYFTGVGYSLDMGTPLPG